MEQNRASKVNEELDSLSHAPYTLGLFPQYEGLCYQNGQLIFDPYYRLDRFTNLLAIQKYLSPNSLH
jgi:hypothetical protein